MQPTGKGQEILWSTVQGLECRVHDAGLQLIESKWVVPVSVVSAMVRKPSRSARVLVSKPDSRPTSSSLENGQVLQTVMKKVFWVGSIHA